MKKFKLGSILIAAAILFGSTIPASTTLANQGKYVPPKPLFSVYVEGKPVAFNAPLQTEEGRLLVEVDPVAKALGASVFFNSDSTQAEIIKADVRLQIDFKQGTVVKNGQAIPVSPKPKLQDGQPVLPARFLAETFGLPITWDSKTNEVRLGPSQATLDKWAVIRTQLVKSRDAMQQLNSFTAKAQYEIHAQLPITLAKLDVSGEAKAVFHKEPLAVHVQTSPGSTSNLPPNFADNLLKEWNFYIANGKVYSLHYRDPKKWKVETLSERESMEASNPFASFLKNEDIEEYLPYTELLEEDGYQMVVFRLTGDDYRAMKQARAAKYGYFRNDYEELAPSHSKLVLYFDKSTAHLVKSHISARLYESVPYAVDAFITLGDFNSAPPVIVSPDALKAEQEQERGDRR
ncbi:copper amine oxidase N-terminal domain-containing protein [Effusibacillus lacus]|uniref:Copper amine oxidase-like N-terminal domain-containing protein n=1 Tax=Effusibacillus lacus TaxID=1348429 RepID=A0A292YIP4_9BACL|nr:copper amine oxidase N-terminal domain-containing protein [Effusibacillus lacus]TCS74299.1 copper amine oxidase-like protein [Effusibacillus lacus]GAX88759.1 hypothetical protein EFBL_0373 [Effusibacillus lacus]